MAKKKLPDNVRERNGKYHFRFDVIDPLTGKRKQKETPGYKTPTEAKNEGIRIKSEILNGTFVEEQDMMFTVWATRWIGIYENSGRVKPSTIDIRKAKLKHLEKAFAGLRVNEVTKLTYQQFLNDLCAKYARKTVCSIHEAGNLLFGKAVEMEIIKNSPTKYVQVPIKQKTVAELEQGEVPKYLEKEQLATFLNAIKQSEFPHEYPLYLLLAYTGMRIGELAALKWKDINKAAQTISITKTLYRSPAIKMPHYELQTPKTKTSQRVIDLDESVFKVLDSYRIKQKELKLGIKGPYHESEFVFTRSDRFAGYPLSIVAISLRTKKMLKKLKLPPLTPHSFRHTHTSLLAEAGVRLETIMARLGHSNDKLTRIVYLHVTKTQSKEASHKFAQLMQGLD
jgi:integrase